jgi:hypothetical protein
MAGRTPEYRLIGKGLGNPADFCPIKKDNSGHQLRHLARVVLHARVECCPPGFIQYAGGGQVLARTTRRPACVCKADQNQQNEYACARSNSGGVHLH